MTKRIDIENGKMIQSEPRNFLKNACNISSKTYITKPEGFDAYIGVFTFQMIGWTSEICRVTVRTVLIRSFVVLTIIDSITHLRHRNTPSVRAGEFPIGTFRVLTIFFI